MDTAPQLSIDPLQCISRMKSAIVHAYASLKRVRIIFIVGFHFVCLRFSAEPLFRSDTFSIA